MTTVTFTNGLVILVEADRRGEWFQALPWQEKKFIEVMRFGTMKSMCFPNPIEYSPEFSHNGMKYRFVIENDWGPCWIENMTTKRKRKIVYFELGNIYKNGSFGNDAPEVITSKFKIKN